METKTCTKCGKTKSISQFEKCGAGENYGKWRIGLCTLCRNERHTQKRIEIKLWIKNLKAARGCLHCGIKDFRVLDFHHSKGDKEQAIGLMVHHVKSRDRILKEIEKCDVLCSNCHRIHHYEEREQVSQEETNAI